jgi:uncharacterized protein
MGPTEGRAQPGEARVSFDEAVTAFSDESALLIDDPDHSNTEERFILLGLSANLRLLVVVHCYREAEAVVRLISARRANRIEQHWYRTRNF